MTIDSMIHMLVTDWEVMIDSMMRMLMIDMILGLNIDGVSKTLWGTAWHSCNSCVCFWCSCFESVIAFRMEINDVAVFESPLADLSDWREYLWSVQTSIIMSITNLETNSFALLLTHTASVWGSSCICRIIFPLTSWLVYGRRRGMPLKRTKVVHIRESSTTTYKTLRRLIVW